VSGKAKVIEKRSSKGAKKGCTHMEKGIRLIRKNCVCPKTCACRKGDGCTSGGPADAEVEVGLDELPSDSVVTEWHLMAAARLKEFFKAGLPIKIIMCTEKISRKTVAVVCGCMAMKPGEPENIYPLAKLFDGEAFDELEPPDGIAKMRPGGTH
jgi:hypothetical protein